MSLDPKNARNFKDVKTGSPCLGCRYDPTGKYLFVSAHDFTIYRFDTSTYERTEFKGHRSWVRGMAFVNGELISSDYQGNLIWWKVAEKDAKPSRTIKAHDGWVRAVAVSPDDTTIASCGNDNLVKLWDLQGKPLTALAGHESHVYNVAFHPNGKNIVSQELKGGIIDWELESGKIARKLDSKILYGYDPVFHADYGGARGMTFSKAGDLAICGVTNNTDAFAGHANPLVMTFTWNDGKVRQIKPKDVLRATPWALNYLSDGILVAAGGSAKAGRIWFWNADGTNFHTITTASNIRDMGVHPDGGSLAAAMAVGTVSLYSLTKSTS
jgi:WD40 repeat protein